MPGRRAGLGVGKYNAESLKQGSKRFNSILQTIHFAHLGIIFYYSMQYGKEEYNSHALVHTHSTVHSHIAGLSKSYQLLY